MKPKSNPLKYTQPLPRGRHGLEPETVQASQKSRLIRAMLNLVATQGYARTTVPEVVAAARVSRNAFYEFFSDKEDCFLAACESDAAMLYQDLQPAASNGDWREALSQGLTAYLDWWRQRPELSWAYFVEMPTVGERAVQQRDRAYPVFIRMFAQLAKRVRKQHPGLKPLPEFIPRMLVISVTEYLAAEVRAGRIAQLHALHPQLQFYLIKMLADETTARPLS